MASILRTLTAVVALLLSSTSTSDPGRPLRLTEPPAYATFKLAEPTLPLKVPQEPIEFLAFGLTQRDKYDEYILQAAREWDLDPFVLKGLLWRESGFNPKVTRGDTGATGIAQFVPSGRGAVTRIRRLRDPKAKAFTKEDALDPARAIPAAAELLAFLRDRYGLLPALNAYNTGRPYRHPRRFILDIVKKANQYRTEAGLWPLPCPKKERLRDRPPRLEV